MDGRGFEFFKVEVGGGGVEHTFAERGLALLPSLDWAEFGLLQVAAEGSGERRVC